MFKDRWLVAGLVVGNLLQLAIVYIPAANSLFHTVPIPLREALAIGGAASIVLWIEELHKLIVRHHRNERTIPATCQNGTDDAPSRGTSPNGACHGND